MSSLLNTWFNDMIDFLRTHTVKHAVQLHLTALNQRIYFARPEKAKFGLFTAPGGAG